MNPQVVVVQHVWRAFSSLGHGGLPGGESVDNPKLVIQKHRLGWEINAPLPATHIPASSLPSSKHK